MNLTLKVNYDTVVISGKTVKINEDYDSSTAVNRLVMTLASCDDESAACYILGTDFEATPKYIRYNYSTAADAFKQIARIYDSFSLDSQLFSVNEGAGFNALVKEEDFAESVAILEMIMRILGLDKEYQLISRFTNQGTYVIVRK